MSKRTVAAILSLVLFGALAVFFSLFFTVKQKVENVYKAIPIDAVMVLENKSLYNNFNQLIQTYKGFSGAMEFVGVQTFYEKIKVMDSLFYVSPDVKKVFAKNKLTVSFHADGKNELTPVFYTLLRSKSSVKFLHEFYKKYLHGKKSVERNYNGGVIYSFSLNGADFYFSLYKGVVIISPSDILVESSIRQVDAEFSILDQEGMRDIIDTAGKNSDFNFFVNYRKVFPLLKNVVKKKYTDFIKGKEGFCDWISLDFDQEGDLINGNGFTFYGKDGKDYFEVFNGQSPVKFTLDNVLPSNTNSFIWIGIRNLNKYILDLENYTQLSGDSQRYKDIKSRSGKFGTKAFLNEVFDGELAVAVTNSSLAYENSGILVMKTKSRSLALEKLRKALESHVGSGEVDQFSYEYNIDSETSRLIYKWPYPNVFDYLLYNVSSGPKCNFFTFIGNYLIFAPDQRVLKEFLKGEIRNNTLRNNSYYIDFSKYHSSESNFYFYSNFGLISSSIVEAIKTSNPKKFSDYLAKFTGVSFQLVQSNDKLFTSTSFQYSEKIGGKPHTLWESLLDSVIRTKPFLFENHYTHEKEIFVQDMKNNLYLINNIGRILWKIRLNEAINSEIYQIDFYKNGKYQLMFSTKNYLHVLDRNGNYVERYPVKLRASSSAGMSLFDYENDKDYRSVVPGEDRKVYMYDKWGAIIRGWKFSKSEFEVCSPVQHFRVKGKDYIVFADKYRAYILNRRGEARVKVKIGFEKSERNIFVLDVGDPSTTPSIVTTDNKGVVCRVYFTGDVSTTRFGEYSEGHYFDCQDVDADGIKDYIFVDKKKLQVFSSTKELIFEKNFNYVVSRPIYFNFSSSDRKIGIVSQEENEVYLFNKGGEVYNGFPVQGNTLYSIGYLGNVPGSFNLIVGNDDNFLYNYIVK